MKTICAKQAKVHFADFVQLDQLGVIAKYGVSSVTGDRDNLFSNINFFIAVRRIPLTHNTKKSRTPGGDRAARSPRNPSTRTTKKTFTLVLTTI